MISKSVTMFYKYGVILIFVLFSLNLFGYGNFINISNKGKQSNKNIFEIELIVSKAKKNSPPVDRKKRIRKKNKLKPFRKRIASKCFRKKSKNRTDWSLYDSYIVEKFSYISGITIKGIGVVVFSIGAILANPLIWVLGLIFFLIGLILLLIGTALDFYSLGSFLPISVLLCLDIIIGIVGVIIIGIGLSLGIMSLWVGGIVFSLALIAFLLYLIFIFLL